jgi:hypothetical protein
MPRKLILVVALAGGFGLALAAEAADADRLVEQLGSRKFPEREAAAKELDALGPAALDALKRAQSSEDAEVRRRAGELVARIERRLESQRLLAPRKVSFVCKDRPIPEAVAEFAKQTGRVVTVGGDLAALSRRKLTLDTGETTFWHALDQLCRAAGLVELDSATRNLAGARPMIPGEILLTAEEAKPRPAHRVGAARVRALPPGLAAIEHGRQTGDIHLALGLALDSPLSLDKVLDVRISRAVDEQGQSLPQLAEAVPVSPVNHPVFIANARGLSSAILSTGDVPAPFRLKAGTQPAKRLTELSGTVTARVRTPPEPVMVVDNVFKATGKPVEGKESGRVTVLEAEVLAGGDVKLRVELQPPAGAAFPNAQGKQVQVQAVAIGPGGAVVLLPSGDAPSMKLIDAKGTDFPAPRMTAHRISIINNVWLHEMTLVFKPQTGQAEPAKLQCLAPRLTTVEVPFTLRDVPLP